ncbi:hypothetical protein B0T18DRAFT_59431 [Schizothecium vesticola]|uniref:Uncharacterized protein n=1 Tax=Schizothecium vesticola TaxID=314040 RepID=A0AA40F4G8_9PEZI|nr:hypothetical protein B0T18DRAFT_59431 [Schizothecium vesticola]
MGEYREVGALWKKDDGLQIARRSTEQSCLSINSTRNNLSCLASDKLAPIRKKCRLSREPVCPSLSARLHSTRSAPASRRVRALANDEALSDGNNGRRLPSRQSSRPFEFGHARLQYTVYVSTGRTIMRLRRSPFGFRRPSGVGSHRGVGRLLLSSGSEGGGKEHFDDWNDPIRSGRLRIGPQKTRLGCLCLDENKCLCRLLVSVDVSLLIDYMMKGHQQAARLY